MGPSWVLSAPDGPYVGPMNLAIRVNKSNGACHSEVIAGATVSWYLVMLSSLCNLSEDWAPEDEIYGCPNFIWVAVTSLIARFMGPTRGPSGADRTQVGPMLTPWTLLFGLAYRQSTRKTAPIMATRVTYPVVGSEKLMPFHAKIHTIMFIMYAISWPYGTMA